MFLFSVEYLFIAGPKLKNFSHLIVNGSTRISIMGITKSMNFIVFLLGLRLGCHFGVIITRVGLKCIWKHFKDIIMWFCSVIQYDVLRTDYLITHLFLLLLFFFFVLIIDKLCSFLDLAT